MGNSTIFDASSSYDPNSVSFEYAWNAGDGTTYNEVDNPIFEHTYEERGEYEVSLMVTDPENHSGETTAIAHVYGVEVLVPIFTLML